MTTPSPIVKINTMIAVLRIPDAILIEKPQDFVPSIWNLVLQRLVDRLSQLGHILGPSLSYSNNTPASSGSLDDIHRVIEILQKLTGMTLDHLDAVAILYKQESAVFDLTDLLWEVFKICEQGFQPQSDSQKADTSSATTSGPTPNTTTTTTSSNSKSISRIHLSEHEIQELGLGPLSSSRNSRQPPSKSSSSSSKKKPKKHLRFSFRDVHSHGLHSDFGPLSHSHTLYSRHLNSRLVNQQQQKHSHGRRGMMDRVEEMRGIHRDIRSGRGVEKDAVWVDAQSEPDYLYGGGEEASDDSIGDLHRVEEFVSEIRGDADASFSSFKDFTTTITSPNPLSNQVNGGPPDSQTERNLQNFLENLVPSHLPLLSKPAFKRAERDRAWRLQLDLSRRALNDRLWRQKVIMQKELSRLEQTTPLDALVKDLTSTSRIREKSHQQEVIRQAASQVKNRHRTLVRLQKDYEAIRKETQGEEERQAWIEEGLRRGVIDEYMKAQRAVIVEERREAFDLARKRDVAIRQQEKKRVEEGRKRVAYLTGLLQEAQAEEKLLKKGEQEVLRSLLKDAKDMQRNRIGEIKGRVQYEAALDDYRTETRDQLRVDFRTKTKH